MSIIFTPSAGGSSDMEQLSTQTLGAAATNIDFTGLDIDSYKGFVIVLNVDSADAGGQLIKMYVDDGAGTLQTTDTDYYKQRLLVGSTTVEGLRANDPEIAYAYAGESNGIVIHMMLDINDYPIAFSSGVENAPSSVMFKQYGWKKKTTSSNITKIRFTHGGTNGFATGCVATVYGLK